MPQVLIVDDSPDSRIILEAIAREADLGECVHADSAANALRYLASGDASGELDLILLDIGLPDLDGIATCRRIRKLREWRHVPIIVVTAHRAMSLLEAAFEEGADDYLVKPVRPAELVARARAALRRRDEIVRQNRVRDRLEFRADYDTVSGLARRHLLLAELRREWRRCMRGGTPLAALMLDVDHFHSYNEAYGHLVGDDCLARISERLRTGMRRGGDLVARFGGEEFAVLLPDTDLAGAIVVGEELRRGIQDLAVPHVASNVAACVTVSVGVACVVPSSERAPMALLAAADEALYLAKARGRNRVCAAEPSWVTIDKQG
jgi:diguanylate cyclase (GGDEF)-like protein